MFSKLTEAQKQFFETGRTRDLAFRICQLQLLADAMRKNENLSGLEPIACGFLSIRLIDLRSRNNDKTVEQLGSLFNSSSSVHTSAIFFMQTHLLLHYLIHQIAITDSSRRCMFSTPINTGMHFTIKSPSAPSLSRYQPSL